MYLKLQKFRTEFYLCFRQYIPKNKKIEIDFSDINWTVMNQLPCTPTKQDLEH